MFVFDATPLICLASVERLHLVSSLPGDCCLPEAVYEEVVTAGINAGHADARRIERAIEDDRFAVESDPDSPLVGTLDRSDRLGGADIAVLALAADAGGTAVMDEQYGRTVADTEGIPTRGTAYVVLRAQKAGQLTATAARTTIDELIDAGWYCEPDLYSDVRRKIAEIDRTQ
jgi:predicted nucleic acid-binding protein